MSRALHPCSRVTPGPSGHFRLTWSSPQQRFPPGTFSFLGSGPAPDRPGLGSPVWSGHREAELGTGSRQRRRWQRPGPGQAEPQPERERLPREERGQGAAEGERYRERARGAGRGGG